MKEFFTDEHKSQKLHEIELPDLILYAEWIESLDSPRQYRLCGTAVTEGEKYYDFVVIFEAECAPAHDTIDEIMELDWEWYDYEF